MHLPQCRYARPHVVVYSHQGRQFRFRGVRGKRYKYVWSSHDNEELYDLETDSGERVNRAGEPVLSQIQEGLKTLLFQWMEDEGDWLAGPGHHQSIGSYIDGRDRTEQHIHPEV